MDDLTGSDLVDRELVEFDYPVLHASPNERGQSTNRTNDKTTHRQPCTSNGSYPPSTYLAAQQRAERPRYARPSSSSFHSQQIALVIFHSQQ
jgi:hypothetical protein